MAAVISSVSSQIAVIGSGAQWAPQAEEVGRLLAERGCVVVCGGLGEVMEAAARGAKDAGGTTVGVLPGESTKDANPWIDYAVATGTGHARNLPSSPRARRRLPSAVAGGRWPRSLRSAAVVVLEGGPEVGAEAVHERADSPAEAVEAALRAAEAV